MAALTPCFRTGLKKFHPACGGIFIAQPIGDN